MTVTASKYARAENDLYQTEPWATEALLRHFPIDGLTVWEPAAGNHLMADVLREQAAAVITSDIVTYGRQHSFIMDFLEIENGKPAKRQPEAIEGSRGTLAVPENGNRRPVFVGQTLTERHVGEVRGQSGDVLSGSEADGACSQAEVERGAGERPLQGRDTEHRLPENDHEEEVRAMRQSVDALDPSSRRGAHQQRGQQSRGALLSLPHQPPQDRMVAGESDCIITNPPYGKGNRDARLFAEYALTRCKGLVALLLTAKFDFGSTRKHLFQNNPRFAAKITLTDRISWTLDGVTGTEDHAWYVWTEKPRLPRAPVILYAGRTA